MMDIIKIIGMAIMLGIAVVVADAGDNEPPRQ